MTEGNTKQPPSPSPEHARLNIFVGKWKTEGQMKASPSGPAARIEGVDTYEWLPGGFFLLHKIDARVGDEEIKGIEIMGYDSSSQTYPTRSFDNKGNTGTYQASVLDGVWTFRGESERFTGSFSDGGDTLTGVWERSSDGSKWLPWMHVTLTKSV